MCQLLKARTLNRAVKMMNDTNDPLAHYRDQFHIPENMIYLDGNSLGAMVKTAPARLEKAIRQEWGNDLITSWNKAGWWQLPLTLGAKIAPLIGAAPDSVVVTDSTSINIYKALHAALALKPDRSVIIAEKSSFPTDLYIAEGVASTRPNLQCRLIGEADKALGEALDDVLDDGVAVVLLNHVDYRSGTLLDMAEITGKIHAAGAIAIWDLCHSAGVFPVELDAANVDFAIGCSYKYLNGGPGAPAFIYANKRHHDQITQPLTGWWGHAEPFAFKQGFKAEIGVRAFLCGTQPILSMLALEAALEVFDGVDMSALREKSKALTSLFADLVLDGAGQFDLTLFGPQKADQRGSQVSFCHKNGYAIMQALIARGVIGDFRQPDIIRFGFAPLYIGFDDVRNAARILLDILANGDWKQYENEQDGTVT